MIYRSTASIAALVVMSGGFACSSGSSHSPDGASGATTTPITGSGGASQQGPSGAGAPSTQAGSGGIVGVGPGSGGTMVIPPIIGSGGVPLPPIGGAPPIGGSGAAGAPPMMGTAGAVGAGGGEGVPLTPPGMNCLKPGKGDYMSPGPYPVAKEDVDLGMISSTQHTGKFTIYYPNPLETSCPHPIVGWGNGTGVTDSDFTYDFLNSNAASWGMVVAASGEDNTGSGAFHKAGIDYLLKQNEDMTSKFYHKLSTRAGVGGHSQGGIGAGLASSHPNVVALVVEGMTFTATQKVPGLVMTGTNDIVMNAEQTATAATGPDFVAVWNGGNHVGTETVLGYLGLDTTSNDATGSQKGSVQFQRLYAAWFRCFLASDDVACKLFKGGTPDGCGICKDPGWAKLASKNL